MERFWVSLSVMNADATVVSLREIYCGKKSYTKRKLSLNRLFCTSSSESLPSSAVLILMMMVMRTCSSPRSARQKKSSSHSGTIIFTTAVLLLHPGPGKG